MKCTHQKRDGTRCRATALPGKRVCTFHDPDLVQQRAEGRRRGGVNRCRRAVTIPAESPNLSLASIADVVTALGTTFNAVRTGRLDSRVGNCLGVLAGVLLRGIEQSGLEARIAALEGRLQ